MKNISIRNLVLLAILAAWAIVFRMIEIPLLPAAPFLKMDFSDFVVLIATLVHGPLGLLLVATMRDFVWYIVTGGDMGVPIGEFMSITASLVMFLPTYFIIKKYKTIKDLKAKILISISLVLGLVISMSILNYYVTLPFYTKVMNFPIDDFSAYILAVVAPFNLIKGSIYAVGQILLISVITPILQKKKVYYLTSQI